MAAGLGFKTFAVGEVLSAANVNGYLMQGVLVFANATARDAAITSPQEGQFAFTKDNDSLWYYSGSAWVSSGATGDIEGVTAGVGISGGGTSGTVTVTNSMATAIDAKGDLIAGTGADTFARLAVGTNGHTLVANSSTSTGLEWVAAGASGLTFITSSYMNGSAANSGAAFNGVFTSTYRSYFIWFDWGGDGNGNTPLLMRMKYGANVVDSSGNYYSSNPVFSTTATTIAANNGVSAGTEWTLLTRFTGKSSKFGMYMWAGEGEEQPSWTGTGYDKSNVRSNVAGGHLGQNQNYTGFELRLGTGNIEGRVTVYGLAKA
jgi:hypothetical protein